MPVESDDMIRLRSGETDLSHCDFSHEDLSGLNLSNRNFRGTILTGVKAMNTLFISASFRGALCASVIAPDADFSGADFSRTPMAGCQFQRCNFRGANFSDCSLAGIDLSGASLEGADFNRARFEQGTLLDGVSFDDKTSFENAFGRRSIATLPPFANYDHEDGLFHRKTFAIFSDTSSPAEVLGSVTSTTIDLATFRVQVGSRPREIQYTAQAIVQAIDDQLELLRSKIPNDAEEHAAYLDYTGLLERTKTAFTEIAVTVYEATAAPTTAAREEKIIRAADVATEIYRATLVWLRDNAKSVAMYGLKIGMLGTACAFLTCCGMPAWPATIAGALVLEGKPIGDALLQLAKSIKG